MPPRPSSRLRFEIVPDDAPLGEPVPWCTTCGGEGSIPADPIFVNTEHNYGIEYRSEEPCPTCSSICAGCGDAAPEHWRHGDWYCEGCASCDLHQSPYCDDPECD